MSDVGWERSGFRHRHASFLTSSMHSILNKYRTAISYYLPGGYTPLISFTVFIQVYQLWLIDLKI